VEEVRSKDGTPIIFERVGEGPPLIVVGGATCDRTMTRSLAEHLGQHFTVINYDRRGRGGSGDTAPYAVEREIEDLDALIAEAGKPASVYGHSSGAGLVLHAAAYGLPIAKLVLHEPPYVPDGEEERRISREYAEKLMTILAEGRRGDAIELFMTTVGTPQETVNQMREEPWWAGMEAIAPTLAYDSEVMGDSSRGGTIPGDLVALPDGRHGVLEDQEHVVPPELLAPVLVEFFADCDGTRYGSTDLSVDI
jgi:pimeloyl-ACP methyl ester carboxylesterase